MATGYPLVRFHDDTWAIQHRHIPAIFWTGRDWRRPSYGGDEPHAAILRFDSESDARLYADTRLPDSPGAKIH